MEAVAKFVWIIEAFRRAVAACGHRGAFGPPDNGLTQAIHARLGRLAARFSALVAKFQSGTLTPPRNHPRPARKDRPPLPRPILPRRFGFVAAGGYEISGYASHLTRFLAQPETETIIAADPRFGRVLRPLCHMLGIAAPACIRLPARPRKPRPRPPAPPEPEETIVWFHSPGPKVARTCWMPPKSRRHGRAPPSH
ncbi:hypothetical protein AiwAL_14660 [Acidiphilium sp. AL]|uniref:Transposase n=1 Tax=Acidiphilium iwatense TaxID=768198 RepID=A0ABS9E2S6_9PROT|nr:MULTISPECIES: hypothetical protein [Acidiphilium]MCF3948236.1 hypothetical protein [Acidiphilium iwatense]MCU4161328.1 hypothetical protein [Acidiphilium sp. AL]